MSDDTITIPKEVLFRMAEINKNISDKLEKISKRLGQKQK